MGLSTNVPQGGGGMSKTLEAGQPVFKINSIELNQMPWMEKDNAYQLTMHCESKPIEGFEGFFIDPNNESLGRYKGQIGRIKSSNWPYKDFTLKSGDKIERDVEIMKAINRICLSVGSSWLKDVDNKYNTIEELVQGFNEDKPFEGKYIKATVACREYARPGKDYNGKDLYLPKGKRGFLVMEAADAKVSKLLPYNEADHYEAYVPEDTEAFEGGDDDGIPTTNQPEFDI